MNVRTVHHEQVLKLHVQAFGDLPENPDGWIHLPLLDLRKHGLAHLRTLRERIEAEALLFAQALDVFPEGGRRGHGRLSRRAVKQPRAVQYIERRAANSQLNGVTRLPA